MGERPAKGANGNNGWLEATVFEKCSREFHRPQTNQGCARGSCQHTCEPPVIERCAHKWTVRYVVNGVQREKSFADEMMRAGGYGKGPGCGRPAISSRS